MTGKPEVSRPGYNYMIPHNLEDRFCVRARVYSCIEYGRATGSPGSSAFGVLGWSTAFLGFGRPSCQFWHAGATEPLALLGSVA